MGLKGEVKYYGNQYGHYVVLTGDYAEFIDRVATQRGISPQEVFETILDEFLDSFRGA